MSDASSDASMEHLSVWPSRAGDRQRNSMLKPSGSAGRTGQAQRIQSFMPDRPTPSGKNQQ
ncbi:MAG: hypothetical protein MH252_17390 [Thermosynechococcaceae cyanobacterium MS004]|nr:hypothetical protein [Thermosynechococcaceae cyanobacterium MS004]